MKIASLALSFTSLIISGTLLSAVNISSIPRSDTSAYLRGGLFEGGADGKANLESIRYAPHPDFERWVVDFSDTQARKVGEVAPKFQLQYYEEQKGVSDKGVPVVKAPAKFVFLFQSIDKVFLVPTKLTKLVRKSRFVKDIVLYPPIENGDMAVEIILAKNVAFKPHQPLSRAGRVVLDIKNP